jgi:chromosome segregation protein
LLREVASHVKQALALNSHEAVKASLTELHGRLEAFLAVRKPSVDSSLTAKAETLRASLASLAVEVVKLRAEEEEEMRRREELQRSFRGKVEALERERSALRILDQEIQGELLRKERSQLQLSELEHEWHTLGKPKEELHALPEPAEPVELPEAERRILRLRGELLAIGEIDEAVVKEATEAEERHAFLTRELEDLTVAVRDLKNLIRELDHRIHEDFKSAFRSINDEFNNYFRLMFGGGKAKLKLVTPKSKEDIAVAEVIAAGADAAGEEAVPESEEHEEDPELQAGIEVDLSLPRKRITSLEMLSGGEKSLVSIAALFALIAVSPPPFLVLDEVDAPLDEQNARRFAELVKSFAEKSQFVIVTHNRATMEAADVLYGVTMGDDGVSKVLSLKLEGA